MNIHPDPATLVDQLAASLRREIAQGVYGTSGVGRIPTVTALAKRWKTSRQTVSEVLHLLRAQGAVYRHDNSIIVGYPPIQLEGITKNFEATLAERGHEVTVSDVTAPAVEDMPADIAALFGQKTGIRVVHRIRKQGLAELPLRLAENWYPADLISETLLKKMRNNSRMDVLGAIVKQHGLTIAEAQDRLMVRIPTPVEVEQLELARMEPILEIQRSTFTADGRPVMWNRIVHRGPMFEFTYRYPVSHWLS